MSELRYFEDFAVGERYRSRGRTFSDADIRLFVGATGADHPNHTDEEYCKGHPIFERACVPGVLTIGVADAFTTEAITHHASLALSYGYDRIRFLKPVYPGDTVHAEIIITDKVEKGPEWGVLGIDVNVKNQRDESVTYLMYRLLVHRRQHVQAASPPVEGARSAA